jgi:glycine/D-amino acid oxidase-like deaminating enzyme
MLLSMPGYGARYWADRTAKSRRKTYPKFRGAASADAVVIGGGFTGCAAAYVLANGGFDVVLLEADKLAEGGTAGSPGIIVPQPDADFRSVEQLAGRRPARIGWQAANRGAGELAAALRKLKIGEIAPAPVLLNARTGDDVERLRREQSTRKAAGLAAPFLGAEAARALTHSESLGGIRLQSGFLFDPVRAALGLATAAEKQGARIFEGSPVRRTRFTRKTADVLAAGGTIRTKLIVVATGGPGALFGQLRRHVREMQGFGVVTDVLPAGVRKEIGVVSASMTEPGGDVWTRPMPDHRVLFAGAPGRPAGPRAIDKTVRQRTAQLMYELSLRYPPVSGVPAMWGWSLPVVTTPDGLPWIGPHRNYPFHFFAMAFGWHGDALAWWAAKAALRTLRGEPRKDDEALGFARYL